MRADEELVRTAAFRLLLAAGKPLTNENLVDATRIRAEEVADSVRRLDGAGRIRRDHDGHVVASAGLSVNPDRHAIELDGRRFWTWCAYDIFGIFGALRASGHALSPSPDGSTIEVVFDRGRPAWNLAVLFRPDDALLTSCGNVYEEWCPNSNLFGSTDSAERWAAQHRVTGRILNLEEAADLGAAEWAGVRG
jgi:alkylmercury lyase